MSAGSQRYESVDIMTQVSVRWNNMNLYSHSGVGKVSPIGKPKGLIVLEPTIKPNREKEGRPYLFSFNYVQ